MKWSRIGIKIKNIFICFCSSLHVYMYIETEGEGGWWDRDQNSFSLCATVDPCACPFLPLIFGQISNHMECKTIQPTQMWTGSFSQTFPEIIIILNCASRYHLHQNQSNCKGSPELSQPNIPTQPAAHLNLSSPVTVQLHHLMDNVKSTRKYFWDKFKCFIAKLKLYILLPGASPPILHRAKTILARQQLTRACTAFLRIWKDFKVGGLHNNMFWELLAQ